MARDKLFNFKILANSYNKIPLAAKLNSRKYIGFFYKKEIKKINNRIVAEKILSFNIK